MELSKDKKDRLKSIISNTEMWVKEKMLLGEDLVLCINGEEVVIEIIGRE